MTTSREETRAPSCARTLNGRRIRKAMATKLEQDVIYQARLVLLGWMGDAVDGGKATREALRDYPRGGWITSRGRGMIGLTPMRALICFFFGHDWYQHGWMDAECRRCGALLGDLL
jgi:hypothetical protein